jgi:hypothetical protein
MPSLPRTVSTLGVLALIATVAISLSGPARAQAPAPAPAQAPAASDVVTVEAEGEATTKELALKMALRAALEKGGKQEIFSDTKVQNYQLLHDTIISRAQGIVKDYKVVRETPVVGGTFKVVIRAQVSKSALARSWGEVQNILKQMGRPKILVWINERIDGRPEEQSILETNIEERLLKSGFDLVAKKAVDAIRQKESADAAAENNVKKLQAIAKDAEAHIFITGTANANQAGIENLYGAPVAFYNCDAQLKVYYTDTGDMLASKGIPNTRGGARGRVQFSPQAGKMALANVCDDLLNDLYEQVMVKWATAISAGGDLTLEVEGLKFKEANQLKKLLAAMKGVEDVNMEMSKGMPRYRIKVTMGGQDFAEKLTEGEFDKLIEIVDVKLNRIQAKAK